MGAAASRGRELRGAGWQGVAIGLYLLGFPREFWRGAGGRMVLVAWGLLVVALGARLIECLLLLENRAVSTFYSGAWRHIWIEGVVLLLLGLGTIAAVNCVATCA